MNQRIENLQSMMRQDHCDGAFYSTSANMQYFLNDTHYPWERTPYSGFVFPEERGGHQINIPDCILYVPVEGSPLLFTSYQRAQDMASVQIPKVCDYFCRLTDRLSEYVTGSRFALGESGKDYIERYIKAFIPEAEFINGEPYGTKLRAIKDPEEIRVLKELCRITDESMGYIVDWLKPGITNAQVEDYIAELGRSYGCTELPFPPTVRFYHTHRDYPFNVDGYRTVSTLEPGCSISFDYGFTRDGYCSDFGRSFYCGEAPPALKDAYLRLQEAQVELINRIKPGDSMKGGFTFIKKYLEAYGYGDYLRQYYHFNLLGHQVGIDVHEGPWLHDEQEEVFQPGMIFTIEPKFWWPDQGFMRVEDMILITESKAECLTNYDRNLFELPL